MIHHTLIELIEGKLGSTVLIEKINTNEYDLHLHDEIVAVQAIGPIIVDAILTKRDFFYNDFLHNNFSLYDEEFIDLVVENYENNKDWVGMVYRKNVNFASNNPRPIPREIDLLLRLRGE